MAEAGLLLNANSDFVEEIDMKRIISILVLLTPLHATDYTRMAQDILRSSQVDTQSHLSDATKTAEELRKSLPEQGSFYGFDIKDLKLKSDKEIKNFVEGHSCKKGKLTPIENQTSEVSNSSLLVFVSFGLSDSILKALHDQIKTLGGRLVVRGLLNDSFPDTQKRLKTLGITVDIHPVWFTDHDVQRVPTFVVKDGDRFDKVSGNVSCYAALEAIQYHGELKEKAATLLDLKERNHAS